MVWWRLRRRSLPTCWRGSTGGIRSAPGARRWPGEICAAGCEFACTTTGGCDPIRDVSDTAEPLPDDVDALKAALLAERAARRELAARAAGAEAMVAHLKLQIAKFRRDRFAPSAERGSKLLDQLELQLEEAETEVAEDAA